MGKEIGKMHLCALKRPNVTFRVHNLLGTWTFCSVSPVSGNDNYTFQKFWASFVCKRVLVGKNYSRLGGVMLLFFQILPSPPLTNSIPYVY